MTNVDNDMDIFTQALSSVIDRNCDRDIASGIVAIYGFALARAEAAEASAYERLEDTLFAEQRATDADLRAEAAEARVADLEAELAAQQWRPVTEKPTADETYLLYRASPPQTEPWRYDFGVWEDDRWDNEGFTHWRPLPPAPQETTQ